MTEPTDTEFVAGFTAQAMLCDSASAVEGKLYIHGGGWNAIAANRMPLALPRISLALLVGVPYRETDSEHELTVGLEDEDGSQLPLGPPAEVGRTPTVRVGFGVGRPPTVAPGDSQLFPFALNVDGYVFHRPGGYAFVVGVDAAELTRVQFRVHLRG